MDRPRPPRLGWPRHQRDRRPRRRGPAVASPGPRPLTGRLRGDRGAGTADGRRDRPARRHLARRRLGERSRRGAARAWVARHPARPPPSGGTPGRLGNVRCAAAAQWGRRPGRLPHPAGSAHQRRPPRGRQRPGRGRLRRCSGRAQRHQPPARAALAAIRRGPRVDRDARARDPARRPPRHRSCQPRLPPPRPHPVWRSAAMTRVLIADDDDLMRAGLAELLTVDPEIEVAGQAATGREAVEQARRLTPDVVLMDVRMPDLDGIAATRELARAAPGVRVLILTTFEQDDYVFGALRAGASGFLLKRTRPEELLAAVHTIAAGEALLSPSVTRRVIDRMAQQPTPKLADQAKLEALTPREREVLELIARGMSNREIAAALAVEESTVRTHVKRILTKLELRDRVQAVIFAYETGINRPAVGVQPPRPHDQAIS